MSKSVARRGAVYLLCIVPLFVVLAVASFVALGGGHHQTAAAPTTPAPTAAQARLRANYAALPLAFEENLGQTDSQVKYLARGDGYTLFLTANDAVFSLRSASTDAGSAVRRTLIAKGAAGRSAKTESTAVVHMQLTGANLPAKVSASDQMPGKSNYFIGNDPSKWQTAVPHYTRVSYEGVYPGVNLAFHGAQRQTEFDFIVAPGADPTPIGFHFTGARAINTEGSGNLEISSRAGNILLRKPVAYQELGGRRQLVDAQFVLQAGNKVGFALGNYDRSRELVIDPSVTYMYSTYLGGSGDDEGQGIAFDSSGNAYVTGQTASANFPGASNYPAGATANAFVTKIAADGSSLIYSTYVGGTGSGGDSGNAIAIDSSGDVFVTGGTSSTNFPVAGTPFQGACKSCTSSTTFNAFVFELNSAGSALTYSTYLGGTGSDVGLGIALASDGSGDVVVVGNATSADFPTLNPIQPYITGSASSGFVTKLNSSGSALVYSTYLGGSSAFDEASAVAVDSSDNAYVTGQTFNSNFHTTTGAFQGTCGGCSSGNSSAFVTVINSGGTEYVYSTFLGAAGPDAGDGIAVDSTSSAYVTGTTESSNFPTTATALQTKYGGATDAFVTKFNPTGTALVYSTYLGGSSFDAGASIAVDSNGNAYVTGQTDSSSASGGTPFPMVNATQSTLGGGYDAFVSEINSSGTQLVFSTYLGGAGNEDVGGDYGAIAVNSAGANIYVTGDTASTNFPTQAPYPYPGGDANGGGYDAFVVKYTQAVTPTFTLGATAPSAVSPGSSATSSITLTSNNGYNSPVNLTCSVSGSGSPLPACSASSFSTNPVTPAATGATSTLTVTTTGPSAAVSHPRSTFYGLWLPVAGFSLVGVVFSTSPSQRRKIVGALLIGMVLISLVLMPACGGSSHSGGGGGGTPGTPAGSYTITITATGTDANHTTQTSQITLTVN